MSNNSFLKKIAATISALSVTVTLCACQAQPLVDIDLTSITPPAPDEIIYVDDPPTISINADGYVVFGEYEQDGNISNGPEPIEWIVLDTNDTGVLLLSRYVLDCKPYDTERNLTTWGSSYLRVWLNTDFYTDSFTNGDRLYMVPVTNKNENNAYWGTNGGDDTDEKIFVLDIEELKKYFPTDLWYDGRMFGLSKGLIAEATPAAIENGVLSEAITDTMATENADVKRFLNDNLLESIQIEGFLNDNLGTTGAQWWVRNIGSSDSTACYISSYGRIGYYYSTAISDPKVGVRPCLYIKELPKE